MVVLLLTCNPMPIIYRYENKFLDDVVPDTVLFSYNNDHKVSFHNIHVDNTNINFSVFRGFNVKYYKKLLSI